jgi:hypothetical protein
MPVFRRPFSQRARAPWFFFTDLTYGIKYGVLKKPSWYDVMAQHPPPVPRCKIEFIFHLFFGFEA